MLSVEFIFVLMRMCKDMYFPCLSHVALKYFTLNKKKYNSYKTKLVKENVLRNLELLGNLTPGEETRNIGNKVNVKETKKNGYCKC